MSAGEHIPSGEGGGATRWDDWSYAAKQNGQAMGGACSWVKGAWQCVNNVWRSLIQIDSADFAGSLHAVP